MSNTNNKDGFAENALFIKEHDTSGVARKMLYDDNSIRMSVQDYQSTDLPKLTQIVVRESDQKLILLFKTSRNDPYNFTKILSGLKYLKSLPQDYDMINEHKVGNGLAAITIRDHAYEALAYLSNLYAEYPNFVLNLLDNAWRFLIQHSDDYQEAIQMISLQISIFQEEYDNNMKWLAGVPVPDYHTDTWKLEETRDNCTLSNYHRWKQDVAVPYQEVALRQDELKAWASLENKGAQVVFDGFISYTIAASKHQIKIRTIDSEIKFSNHKSAQEIFQFGNQCMKYTRQYNSSEYDAVEKFSAQIFEDLQKLDSDDSGFLIKMAKAFKSTAGFVGGSKSTIDNILKYIGYAGLSSLGSMAVFSGSAIAVLIPLLNIFSGGVGLATTSGLIKDKPYQIFTVDNKIVEAFVCNLNLCNSEKFKNISKAGYKDLIDFMIQYISRSVRYINAFDAVEPNRLMQHLTKYVSDFNYIKTIGLDKQLGNQLSLVDNGTISLQTYLDGYNEVQCHQLVMEQLDLTGDVNI